MAIQALYSAKRIERQFHTGEEPVMVMCSDVNIYVCKYMRSSATAYKLACELIGAKLAKAWRLTTPDIALVNIRPAHWEGINISHSLSAPSIGFRWLDGMVDIIPSTYAEVPAKTETLAQLMKINSLQRTPFCGRTCSTIWFRQQTGRRYSLWSTA